MRFQRSDGCFRTILKQNNKIATILVRISIGPARPRPQTSSGRRSAGPARPMAPARPRPVPSGRSASWGLRPMHMFAKKGDTCTLPYMHATVYSSSPMQMCLPGPNVHCLRPLPTYSKEFINKQIGQLVVLYTVGRILNRAEKL